jgi:hypothetical protein
LRLPRPDRSYSTHGMRGDRPELWVAPSSGGTASSRGDLEATFGDALIVREKSGFELLQGAKRTQLAPAECEKVLHVDASRNRILIGCKDGSQDGSYAVRSPAGAKRLALRTLGASDQPEGTRFVHVPGYARDAFVDFETQRVYELREHEWARAKDGLRAVIAKWDGGDNHALFWADVASGKRKPLTVSGKPSGYADAAGPMIAIPAAW